MLVGKKALEHMMTLIRERNHLESLLEPTDTGHISTAIRVIDGRINELKEQIGDMIDGSSKRSK